MRAARMIGSVRARNRRGRGFERAPTHSRCALIDLYRRRRKSRSRRRRARGDCVFRPTAIAAPRELQQLGGLTLQHARRSCTMSRRCVTRISDLIFGVGPAGTGKTLLAVAAAVEALKPGAQSTASCHAAGGRGGRTARLPAGRSGREGRSVPAADLGRVSQPDGRDEFEEPPRTPRNRGRAAGVHARAHALECLCDRRRGAELDDSTDEDGS